MKRTILLLTVLTLGTTAFAADISASYSDSNFEEMFYVNKVESIEMWEQPRTQYTPKNLRTQYQMRFNGRTSNGVASYTLPIVDYDTYITESYFKDGKFYVKDNLGRSFQTGELQEIDTSALETAIQNNSTDISNLTTVVNNNTTAIENNTNNINNLQTELNTTNIKVNKNTQDIRNLDSRVTTNTNNIELNRQSIQNVSNQVHTNTQNIGALRTDVSKLHNRVDNMQSQINRLDDRMEKGFATVAALTALHPNPRHQGKTQISVGTGMYADNVAGAIGVFHYLNDRVMLSGGASYGGGSSWAGNVGITIGF